MKFYEATIRVIPSGCQRKFKQRIVVIANNKAEAREKINRSLCSLNTKYHNCIYELIDTTHEVDALIFGDDCPMYTLKNI